MNASCRSRWILSIAVALLSGLGGLVLSAAIYVPSGAAIVLVLSASFFIALAVGRVKRTAANDTKPKVGVSPKSV